MNNNKYQSTAKRNHVAFPSFANMINEIMNTPLHTVVNQEIKTTVPAINVRHNDKSYILEMALPGYAKKDINVEIKDEKLIISSDIQSETTGKYRLQEFNYGAFSRAFTLPKDADANQVSAKVENGILTVIIDKMPKPEPLQIKIK